MPTAGGHASEFSIKKLRVHPRVRVQVLIAHHPYAYARGWRGPIGVCIGVPANRKSGTQDTANHWGKGQEVTSGGYLTLQMPPPGTCNGFPSFTLYHGRPRSHSRPQR